MNKIILILVIFFTCIKCNAETITDEIADNLPKSLPPINIKNKYNYDSTIKIPIELKIINTINSEKELYENQIINFKVAKDVIYNDKIIVKRGTLAPAKVSVIVLPGMNGIPASIVFKDFEIEGLEKEQLTNYYEIFGQDRTMIILPLKWLLTILPPSGSLTNLIMGGHVKLKPKKHITIFYYHDFI